MNATEQQRPVFPQISIYLPDDLKAAVDQFAHEHGVTRAKVVRRLLRERLIEMGRLSPEPATP